LRIGKVKFRGLYSYGDETEMSLQNVPITLVVGPNNSGKSNLLRILSTLATTLTHRQNQYLGQHAVFSDDVDPTFEVKFVLSADETDSIIDFLSFHEVTDELTNNAMWTFTDFRNKKALRERLSEITIGASWKHRQAEYERETVDLRVEFDRIENLKMHSPWFYTDLFINSSEDVKNSQKHLRTYLDNLDTEAAMPEGVRRLFTRGERQNKVVTHIPLQGQSGYGENGTIAFRRILALTEGTAPRQSGGITFLEFFGVLLKRSLHHAEAGRSFRSGKIEYTDELLGDGTNLAQFLHSLRNSPSLEGRKRFYAIKQAFEDVVQADQLTFDVILEYKAGSTGEQPRIREGAAMKKPESSKIVIHDNRVGKEFALEAAGSGIAEVIYLLTLAYGVKDGIILMDEPAINLHPPLMRGLVRKVIEGMKTKGTGSQQPEIGNQFFVITHSTELISSLLFEQNVGFFYVQRSGKDGGSVLRSLDPETKEWFASGRHSLKHRIDTRIFLGRKIILTEGESDTNFLIECTRHFASIDNSMDISSNDVLIVNVNGKGNFAKYKKLMDSLSIPYVILGDEDVLQGNDTKSLFTPCALINKGGITGDNNSAFVIENKDLEGLMKELDPSLYEEVVGNVRALHGRNIPKSEVAAEFTRRLATKTPRALDPIGQFLRKAMG